MSDDPTFTCKDCGSTELRREHRYDWVQPSVGYLECGCERKQPVAAVRKYRLLANCVDVYEIVDCHYFGRTISEDVLRTRVDDMYVDEVLCEDCFEGAQEEDWTEELVEPGDFRGPYRTNVDVRVRCAGCGREIEFGWDNPPEPLASTLGLPRVWVYPVECSDFDPARCWPDAKYEESWRERGWWGKIQGDRNRLNRQG